jgi:2-polyprenyl-3-methyl-5-hydroxy-6-metoxy-1,4-benzoquinol methylase
MDRRDALTAPAFWDDYWRDAILPAEATRGTHTSIDAILDVIDRYVDSDTPLSVLEIGGAPGRFLAYLWRRFGHEVCVLDSSPVGVELSRRNFALMGVPGQVLHGDFRAGDRPEPRWDVVLSLGLVEHFRDTQSAVAAHLGYVRPGGTLIIGTPNLQGVNLALVRRLSPSSLESHNPEATNIANWPRFERALGLEASFRGYVSGFQPLMFSRCESTSTLDRALARCFTIAGALLDRLNRRSHGKVAALMGSWNSPRWSYYALGVYRKASGDG